MRFGPSCGCNDMHCFSGNQHNPFQATDIKSQLEEMESAERYIKEYKETLIEKSKKKDKEKEEKDREKKVSSHELWKIMMIWCIPVAWVLTSMIDSIKSHLLSILH